MNFTNRTQLISELESVCEPLAMKGSECFSDLKDSDRYNLITTCLKHETDIYGLDLEIEDQDLLQFITNPIVQDNYEFITYQYILETLGNHYENIINNVLTRFFISYNPSVYRTLSDHYADPVQSDRSEFSNYWNAQSKTVTGLNDLLF